MPPMHKQNITNKWAQISVFCFLFLDLPTKVPTKNGKRGTPITGEEMLMNQLGRKGVMRKNIM